MMINRVCLIFFLIGSEESLLFVLIEPSEADNPISVPNALFWDIIQRYREYQGGDYEKDLDRCICVDADMGPDGNCSESYGLREVSLSDYQQDER